MTDAHVSAALGRCLGVLHDVHRAPKTFDLSYQRLSGTHIERRLVPRADTGWRSRQDDVARNERDDLTDVGDDLERREDHVRRVAILYALAVELAAEPQRPR